MNRKTLIAIIGVVAVIFIGTGVYSVSAKKARQAKVVDSVIKIDTTAGWKTATWEYVSFKYPSDWVVSPSTWNSASYQYSKNKMVIGLFVSRIDTDSATVQGDTFFVGQAYTGNADPKDYYDIQNIFGVNFGVDKEASPAFKKIFDEVVKTVTTDWPIIGSGEIIFYNRMQDEIERWSNYKQFENTKSPILGIEGCNSAKAEADYKLFMEKANRDVRKFEFVKYGRYGIDFYGIPNYKISTYTVECNGGLGGISPLATYKDFVVWGYLPCSAGAMTEDEGSQGERDYNQCEKMSREIQNYFKLKVN